jgi:3-dehydroquinate synthase
MSSISIESSTAAYSIHFFEGQLQSSTQYSALIIDENVPVPSAFTGIPALKIEVSEAQKSLSTIENICNFLLESGCNRQSTILAVGGGFIQDVVTLSASLFMRGIDWDYAPTTLIGMADSCIGGKSSINIRGGKNSIGNFYPPREILVSTQFLETLNKDTLYAGLFESVKILFASDPNAFMDVIREPALTAVGSAKDWVSLIEKTLVAKKWFVEKDEFDRNERQLLNFGHTFGHAFESGSGYKVQHGLAVGFGMLAAIEFAGKNSAEPTNVLGQYCLKALRDTAIAQKISVEEIDWQLFEDAVLKDKKNSDSGIALILPNERGFLEKIYVPKDKNSLARIANAMKLAIRKVAAIEIL